MANLAGFVIGNAIGGTRAGLVASLMPSPLVGAIVAQSYTDQESAEEAENDLRSLDSIVKAADSARGYDPSEARRELIAAVKEWLAELEREWLDELEREPT